MQLTTEQRLDLTVATLATYNYGLEKAWALREALAAAGLCEPARVVGRSVEEVGNALKAAGYDRGGITYIIAPRLVSLMGAVGAGRLDPLAAAVAAGDEGAFAATLTGVKGFGPKAAKVAWALVRG